MVVGNVAMTLLGNQSQVSDASKIQFLGKDLKQLSVDERAKTWTVHRMANPVSICNYLFNF